MFTDNILKDHPERPKTLKKKPRYSAYNKVLYSYSFPVVFSAVFAHNHCFGTETPALYLDPERFSGPFLRVNLEFLPKSCVTFAEIEGSQG